MTAAVRPASESAPQREMTSAAAESAALPETGRSSMRSTVSSGIPSADNSGRSSTPMYSGSPEARSRYIAGKSTTSAGKISCMMRSPFAAPAVSAEKMSTPRHSPAMQAAPMMSAGTSPASALSPTAFS